MVRRQCVATASLGLLRVDAEEHGQMWIDIVIGSGVVGPIRRLCTRKAAEVLFGSVVCIQQCVPVTTASLGLRRGDAKELGQMWIDDVIDCAIVALIDGARHQCGVTEAVAIAVVVLFAGIVFVVVVAVSDDGPPEGLAKDAFAGFGQWRCGKRLVIGFELIDQLVNINLHAGSTTFLSLT